MSIHTRRPFVIRPVCLEATGLGGQSLRATFRTAAANYWYIMRQTGVDAFGPTPDFSLKIADLVETGREAPLRAPRTSLAGDALWQAADIGAQRRDPSEATAFHAVGTLPVDGGPDQWRTLIQRFCAEMLTCDGIVVDWGIHALAGEDEQWATPPHVHLLITARSWRPERNPGVRHPRWLTGQAQLRALGDAWLRVTGMQTPVGSCLVAG